MVFDGLAEPLALNVGLLEALLVAVSFVKGVLQFFPHLEVISIFLFEFSSEELQLTLTVESCILVILLEKVALLTCSLGFLSQSLVLLEDQLLKFEAAMVTHHGVLLGRLTWLVHSCIYHFSCHSGGHYGLVRLL